MLGVKTYHRLDGLNDTHTVYASAGQADATHVGVGFHRTEPADEHITHFLLKLVVRQVEFFNTEGETPVTFESMQQRHQRAGGQVAVGEIDDGDEMLERGANRQSNGEHGAGRDIVVTQIQDLQVELCILLQCFTESNRTFSLGVTNDELRNVFVVAQHGGGEVEGILVDDTVHFDRSEVR